MVSFSGRPTFRQPLLQNVVAEELDDVTFTCEVDAMPPADITWFINGQYLSPGIYLYIYIYAYIYNYLVLTSSIYVLMLYLFEAR